MRHQHHVYWRLDFDIEGAGRNVVEQSGTSLPRTPAVVAAAGGRRSDPASPADWRVVDNGTGRGYSITPGPADGTADAYGVADLWALRYRWTELDDGVAVVGGTPAGHPV